MDRPPVRGDAATRPACNARPVHTDGPISDVAHPYLTAGRCDWTAQGSTEVNGKSHRKCRADLAHPATINERVAQSDVEGEIVTRLPNRPDQSRESLRLV